MGLSRTLLRPVAYVAGLRVGRLVNGFLAAHRQTGTTQQQVLRELIAAHRETDFGRDHGFARIGGYEDFARAVPMGDYETLRPYMDRVLAGQTAALLPAGEEALMFSQTSGTTGRPKLIPVTRRFAGQMRRGWNIFGFRMLQQHRDAWLRSILQISSPLRETVSPTGLPCGAISGLLAREQLNIVRRMYVVPMETSSIADPLARLYVTLRCGIERDVAVITTANPSSTIKMIETGQAHAPRLIRDIAEGAITPPAEVDRRLLAGIRLRPNLPLARKLDQCLARDGTLLPRHFWNVSVLMNWTGGTLKLYIPRLRELFGPCVPIRDIGLLASEGRFSIPLNDETAAGVAEITGNFLEFMPIEERDASQPRTVLAHQTQIGQEYFLVVTNWAGLWRYNLDDRVRVVGKLGESPIFEFLSRGLHTASITGEKITEYQVVEAMRLASAALGASVERFMLQGRFAARPYYELRLEAPPGMDAADLARRMDEELGRLNVEYRSKRSSDRLGPIQPVVLADGALDAQERQAILARRGRSEQYKHKYLMTDVLPVQ